MKLKVCTLALLMVAGCSGGSSGSGTPATTTPGSTTAPGSTTSGSAARLQSEYEARKRAYLQFAAGGTGYYAQLSKLELGQASVDRAPIDDMLDFAESRRDTADFKVSALIRFVYKHGQNPVLASDLRGRMKSVLLNFRYWIDEPNPDDMIFWTENHFMLFSSSEYLAGQLYPLEVFPNSGLTGEQHRLKARTRILRWLDERMRFGFSEWYSPVYYPHDAAPLLNLIDFAADPEIRTRAAMALDLLIFDVARLTHKGVFAASSGRTYDEQKLGGQEQGCADMVEVLFGTRGAFKRKGSTDGTVLATSSYEVPPVLLAIGAEDKSRDEFVGRARVGVDFASAQSEGIGFTSLEDGMFWWTQGAVASPEVIALSKDMINTYDLWNSSHFANLDPLRYVPDFLLVAVAQTVVPLADGPVTAGADTYTYRTPDAQLSSVIDYQRGVAAFQIHAWQATLDMDAVVFTTAPGSFGRQGPDHWIGSASLPQISQVEDVALILYNPPGLQRTLFPNVTHAYFPRSAFDEVVEVNGWIFGRKGNGYVALRSVLPTQWVTWGTESGREVFANGYRNAWICHVGRAAEDGSFTQFADAVAQSAVTVQGEGDGPQADPLWVQDEAPGLGTFRLEWGQPATVNGAPVHFQRFPRFDNPYAMQAWGDPRLEIRHDGLVLEHDRIAGTRAGDGL